MLRSFQFNILSHGNQRPNLPYKKALRDIFGGIQSTSLVTGNSVTLLLESSLLNIDVSLTIYLHCTSIYSEAAVTTHHQLINQEAIYTSTVCCCGLQFQSLRIPTHWKLPSRSTRSTFYVPNPPSPLEYHIRSECLLVLSCSRHVGKDNFGASSINKTIFIQVIICEKQQEPSVYNRVYLVCITDSSNCVDGDSNRHI
jgi:hypothetical protein